MHLEAPRGGSGPSGKVFAPPPPSFLSKRMNQRMLFIKGIGTANVKKDF